MNTDRLENLFSKLTDIKMSEDVAGEESYVISAEEQKNLVLLALCFFPQDNMTRSISVSDMVMYITKLVSNKGRSSLVVDLFENNTDHSKISLIQKYGQYLPDEIMIAVVNIVQSLNGKMHVDIKTLNNLIFTKDLRASMNNVEGFQSVMFLYFQEFQKSTARHGLVFPNYKEKIVKTMAQSAITPETSVTMVPQVNTPSSAIYDKEVIDPLRKLINNYFVKSALFNEINLGSDKNRFNIFARFITSSKADKQAKEIERR